MFYMKLFLATSILTTFTGFANAECTNSNISNQDILPCYVNSLSKLPLDYKFLGKENIDGLELKHYQLTSQEWSPGGLVAPKIWVHDVDIYIPKNPILEHAVLFINNGTRYVSSGKPFKQSDMSKSALTELANNTSSIIISISDIPNQYLVYQDDKVERREDVNVARSWTLFMNDPKNLPVMPLHIPMTAAASQAMTLAEHELTEWKINKFIVSGMSKRGWTTWLAAIADTRVEGIIPFVIDILGVKNVLSHMYKVYGNNWPIAFAPYINEKIDSRIHEPEFEALMEISDPLNYLNSPYKGRLSIPKYIINASGDDFFVPDNSQFFYDQMPGEKSLWVVPNVDHNGIKKFAVHPMTNFIKRIQHGSSLPIVESTLSGNKLSVKFSEQPKTVKLWTAYNPSARDFRYACEIRYLDTVLEAKQNVSVVLANPKTGWDANFIEAIFSDGFTSSTQVYVIPDDKYPKTAPDMHGENCKTIPHSSLVKP